MEWLFQRQFYLDNLLAAENWLARNAVALSIATVSQVLVVSIAFLTARYFAPRLRVAIASAGQGRYESQVAHLKRALEPLTLPLIWLAIQWLWVLIASDAGLPVQFVNLVVSLLTAWVVIRLSASLVRNPFRARVIAVTVWTIAALNILNLLNPLMAILGGVAVNLGTLRLSALMVVKGVLLLVTLLWIATLTGRLLEKRIASAVNLTPSLQVLITKFLKIVLVLVAVFAALRDIGIDLTGFAVLTGAIGVGIGFGLQKAVANFVSGVTILLDKSIKPGDVISVGDTYGSVHSLGARYVSVITRDGKEYLIPNEELVTQQVVNWSFSSEQVRMKTPIGISYRSDVNKAMMLCLEAADAVKRVLKEPEPVCLLMGFGDNSVDLELRFWIRDPMNGLSNVRSDVLLQVWQKFQKHGIEIPFPQRDLHFKSPLDVATVRNAILALAAEPPPRVG
jgi:small-conductance mechanosensitive channel